MCINDMYEAFMMHSRNTEYVLYYFCSFIILILPIYAVAVVANTINLVWKTLAI